MGGYSSLDLAPLGVGRGCQHALPDLTSADPPDPPGNLSCTIREHSGCLACTWDAGRPTHLSTRYTLHLRR